MLSDNRIHGFNLKLLSINYFDKNSKCLALPIHISDNLF